MNIADALPEGLRGERVRKALVALGFLVISSLFFNKIFTSDYGIHLSIGREFVETGKVPHTEFLNYPLLGQVNNYEELGFQALLYTVYRAVGTDGVSVFVWLVATLAYFFIYRSLRARDVRPVVALFTMLLFALPFRIRLQPRPEIIAYLFCSYLMYGCSLFYYRGNRRIVYTFPALFLVWANIHPSTLAGLATVGAFGTQSLVIAFRDRFEKESLKRNLLIPLAVLALCVIATFLSKHGMDSLLTPVRLLANPTQRSSISEMTSVVNSGFYGYYKYIFGLCVLSGLLGLAVFRIRIHDLVLAAYGLRLPLQVARGMAFMAVFCVPLVAASFDGAIRRLEEYLGKRREEETRRKAAEAKGAVRKKPRKGGEPAHPVPLGGGAGDPPAIPRKAAVPLILAWLLFFGATGYGAYYIGTGTSTLVELGIGLTKHKFSFGATDFVRSADLKGNMFNFFDLGGFVGWQLYPPRHTFIDGRAGNPQVFEEHQAVTSAMGDVEGLFRKYDIRYIITKTVDSSGMVLPLISYLGQSPAWELVFADGLAVVFIRNIPEHRDLLDRYRVPKGFLARQVASELYHYTFLGVNKAYAYGTIGNIMANQGDIPAARMYYKMALEIQYDPNLAAALQRLDGAGKPR